MTNDLDILAAVVARLTAAGYAATLEYPGFIAIPSAGQGDTYALGNVNATWTGDLVGDNGEAVGVFDTGIPSDCRDVERIAAALAAGVAAAERE